MVTPEQAREFQNDRTRRRANLERRIDEGLRASLKYRLDIDTPSEDLTWVKEKYGAPGLWVVEGHLIRMPELKAE